MTTRQCVHNHLYQNLSACVFTFQGASIPRVHPAAMFRRGGRLSTMRTLARYSFWHPDHLSFVHSVETPSRLSVREVVGCLRDRAWSSGSRRGIEVPSRVKTTLSTPTRAGEV